MQTVLENGNLYVSWMSSVFPKKHSTTGPLQVFPVVGGRTVEHMLYASPHHQKVAGYPLETPHSPCHHQTSPTHLPEGGKRRKWSAPLVHIRMLNIPTDCITFFPFHPSHIVTWGARAALVCQHSLQVVVATVVGTEVYKKKTVACP